MTWERDRRAGELAEVLERAVAGGLLSAEQAQAVLAAERNCAEHNRAEHNGVGGPVGRLPLTEALGYLGGLLALSGAMTLVAQYWQELPTAGRLGLLAAVALVTWLVGARIGDGSVSALIRLRGALWLASSAAVAVFAGQFASDVVRVEESVAWLAAGAAAATHAGLLWRLRDRPAQHLACLAGVIIVAGSAADFSRQNGAIGLAVAVAGALWLAAHWMVVLPPPVIALTGGALAVLAGVGINGGDWPDASPLLGLAASIAFVAVGVGTDRTPLTIVGLIGAIAYLPWTVGHFFADSLGVPLAMLLCGVVLLAATLIVLRKPTPT